MRSNVRRFARTLAASAFALMLILMATAQTAAASARYPVHFPYRGTGYDISWPQCGGAYPAAPFGFGIVGVTDGRANTNNPCLADEFAWAKRGAAAPSLYMNLNYGLSTRTTSGGTSWPSDACVRIASVCQALQAYAYGVVAANNAMAYARSVRVFAPVWWLDIELGNTWSSVTQLNAQVIAGAAATLHAHGIVVGIYCTPYQWSVIAGTYTPHLPDWSAGAPTSNPASYCSADHAFGGGSVWITQYANGSFDGDWAC